MDPTEVRQMVKHQQCVVVIDTSPPIKSGYPPYAVLKQRGIANDYGEPKLVSLEDAEAEHRKVMTASDRVEATEEAAEDSPHLGEAELVSGAETIATQEVTIDGGLNYQSHEVISRVLG